MKLGKLTTVGYVYRGMGNGLLPNTFWAADGRGNRGGVEFAFMSELQTYRVTALQTYRLTDLKSYGVTDLQTFRVTELQTYRLTELQSYRATDLQEHDYE